MIFSYITLPSYNFCQVSAESANQFGELVADPETNELLHYTEKPETFVSTSSDHALFSLLFYFSSLDDACAFWF